MSSRVTFICGQAGVCALGAVVAKHAGDERLLSRYLAKFKEVLCTFIIYLIKFKEVLDSIYIHYLDDLVLFIN